MKMLKKHQLKAIKSVRKVYAPAVQVVPSRKKYDRHLEKKYVEDMRWD